MKNIKFRVYDKDLKKMRYLNTTHDILEFEDGVAKYHNLQTGYGDWFSDLMQYTGLKDKNGKEIYEGDILYRNHELYGEETGVCDFIDGIYEIVYKNVFTPVNHTCIDEWEIVGNVYDN